MPHLQLNTTNHSRFHSLPTSSMHLLMPSSPILFTDKLLSGSSGLPSGSSGRPSGSAANASSTAVEPDARTSSLYPPSRTARRGFPKDFKQLVIIEYPALLSLRLPMVSPSPESKPQLTRTRSGANWLSTGMMILLKAASYSSSPTDSPRSQAQPAFFSGRFQQMLMLKPKPSPSPQCWLLDCGTWGKNLPLSKRCSERQSTSLRLQKMCWVPSPWWASQSTIATRAKVVLLRAYSAAMATLLKKEKPCGWVLSPLWCPGGLTTAKTCWQARLSRALTARRTVLTAANAAAKVCFMQQVSVLMYISLFLQLSSHMNCTNQKQRWPWTAVIRASTCCSAMSSPSLSRSCSCSRTAARGSAARTATMRKGCQGCLREEACSWHCALCTTNTFPFSCLLPFSLFYSIDLLCQNQLWQHASPNIVLLIPSCCRSIRDKL